MSNFKDKTYVRVSDGQFFSADLQTTIEDTGLGKYYVMDRKVQYVVPVFEMNIVETTESFIEALSGVISKGHDIKITRSSLTTLVECHPFEVTFARFDGVSLVKVTRPLEGLGVRFFCAKSVQQAFEAAVLGHELQQDVRQSDGYSMGQHRSQDACGGGFARALLRQRRRKGLVHGRAA